jgi:integrase
MPLSGVTSDVLRDHLRWLKTERHNGTASLRRKIATLKGLFRHGVQQGWLHDNPSDPLAYPPPVRPPLIVLAPSEADPVVVAAVHDPIWHALVLLLLDAGLKRDEALALRAEDLGLARNPERSHVAVRRTGASKRVRRRVVPLTARAHAALVRLLTAPLPGGRLISLSVRGVNFVVETVGQRARITRVKKLTPEILRDTFAVEQMRGRLEAEAALAGNGLPPADLGRLRRDHDAEVLQLLGLSPRSEMAMRYRTAAVATRDATAPSLTAGRADDEIH